MPHRSRTVPALSLVALAGLAFAANPAQADDPPVVPTVTTPSATPPMGETAPKQTPVAPAPYINVSGLIDFYYQYQFSNPKGNDTLTGRIYAVRHNTPTLGLAWVDVYHTPEPGGFGFKVSLATGDSADNDVPNGGSFRGESQFQSFAQAYGTYTAKNGFNVDFGKFLSPYGYDTTEAILNYNYTITLATYLVPNYLAGLRATYPFKSPNIAASIFVVNSLIETPSSGVQDDNGTKDIVLRLNYTSPDGKFSYIPAYGFGKDKLSPGFTTVTLPTGSSFTRNNEKVTLFDNWLTYHATKDITLAGEYVYRKDSDDGGSFERKGHGYGVYYRQQLTPKNAFVLRYSALTNHTDTFGMYPVSSTSFRADEYTATFERKVAANFTTRLEYRHDHSNNPAAFGFLKGSQGATAASQDAAIIAGLFTF